MSSRQAGRVRLAIVLMLVGAALGLVASLVLSIESLVIAKDSQAVLACDMNAVFSCSSVAKHWSASLLGFPNSFIGLAALPVMITIAVALAAGVKFPRWFMRGAQIGVIFGLLFAIWMFYMSFFEIQILCPWCLMLDVGMVLLFSGLTRYNILNKLFGGARTREFIERDFDLLIMALTIVGITVTIIGKYGSQLFA